MPDDSPQVPPAPPTPPDPPEPLITLDEWIAATQACCGVHHDDDEKAR